MKPLGKTALVQSLVGGFMLLRSVVYGALSYVVPKQRGLIVFYPAFEPKRFSGNLRPVFEAMAASPGQRKIVWLTQSANVAETLRRAGYRVSVTRWRPVWPLLRAEWIVLDKNEPRIGLGRFRMVQVWHGAGFKRIALETPGLSSSRLLAMKWHFRSYRTIVASSEEDRARKARCFGNPNVAVLGLPRGDALFFDDPHAALRASLAIGSDRTVITYCPTFRDSGQARPFTAEGWLKLDALLGRKGAVMLVKRHRFDQALRVPDGLAHVRDISPLIEDVNDLLAITHVLISDYSSIVTDFVLIGRPVLFYVYDMEAYQQKGARLYYDLFEVLPGPFLKDEGELIDALDDEGWFETAEYQARYEAFRRRFHQFLDAGATARVVGEIERLIAAESPAKGATAS